MTTLYMEYGSDLQLNPYGGLQTASGWDEFRQNTERLILTNAQALYPDGTQIWPDCVFHPTFGLGVRALLGHQATPSVLSTVKQKCMTGIAQNPMVAQTPPPVVAVTPMPIGQQGFQIYIDVILKNLPPGTVALAVQR